jgi:hypothetical protein
MRYRRCHHKDPNQIVQAIQTSARTMEGNRASMAENCQCNIVYLISWAEQRLRIALQFAKTRGARSS